jgi:hypothetical protein
MVGSSRAGVAQVPTGNADERLATSFQKQWPDLCTRLIGLERAHGVLYGALTRGKGKVRVKESDVFALLKQRAHGTSDLATPDPDADAGYATLGARGAAIIRRTHVFHREVLAIFATMEPSARTAALDAAVERYRSRPDVALPDVPKDMGILYDHPYTTFTEEGFNPRRQQPYPTLSGFVWAAHWFQLATQEPLETAGDPSARAAGLKVVIDRFERKLAAGTPPNTFPAEFPLAPSIAPGLVSVHERSAAILDNLNMLQDVIADILVHPKASNPRAAIDEAIGQFVDPKYRVVEVDEWIKMALRHSIFAQGGPALMEMTRPDRNSSGHAQHARGGRSIPPGGMR